MEQGACSKFVRSNSIQNGGQLLQREGTATVGAGVADWLVSLLPSNLCLYVSVVACVYRDVSKKGSNLFSVFFF